MITSKEMQEIAALLKLKCLFWSKDAFFGLSLSFVCVSARQCELTWEGPAPACGMISALQQALRPVDQPRSLGFRGEYHWTILGKTQEFTEQKPRRKTPPPRARHASSSSTKQRDYIIIIIIISIHHHILVFLLMHRARFYTFYWRFGVISLILRRHKVQLLKLVNISRPRVPLRCF